MENTLNLFQALGDKTRLKIIDFLLGGEKCVCEIFSEVGRTQSTVSIQLKKLMDSRILDSRKDGRRVFYRIVNYDLCEIFKILNYANKRVGSTNCCIK